MVHDEVRSLSNEELADTCWANTAYRQALKAELLRRLSAGNPQVRTVFENQLGAQPGDEECCTHAHPCCVASGYGKTLQEPERSDGRISETANLAMAPNQQRKAEQHETREREKALLALIATFGPEFAEAVLAEAQRSAGRIEAGSVQFPMACYSCGRVHEATQSCQDSENGAVADGEDKIKP